MKNLYLSMSMPVCVQVCVREKQERLCQSVGLVALFSTLLLINQGPSLQTSIKKIINSHTVLVCWYAFSLFLIKGIMEHFVFIPLW